MRFLDVGIGVVFLFLLVSLIVTTVQEGLASMFKMRAANLHSAVSKLLRDPVLGKKLYEHPLISGPYAAPSEARWNLNRWRRPSYIPSQSFVVALLDVLNSQNRKVVGSGLTDLLAGAKQIVATIDNPRLKTALAVLVDDVESLGTDSQAKAKAIGDRLERWFDEAMSRASGWYKRKAQALSFVIGFGVAAAVNADAGYVAQRLWHDASLRASVVAAAEAYKGNTAPAADGSRSFGEQLQDGLDELETSTLPVGWPAQSGRAGWMMLGWLVTALASSLGAPFWFDLLSRVLQIRGSGQPIAAAGPPAASRGASSTERPSAKEPPPVLEKAPASKRPATIA